MKDMKKNMYASGALVLFSLFMIIYAIPTQITTNSLFGGNTNEMGSSFFPYLTSIIIGLFAAVEFIASFIKYRVLKHAGTDGEKEERNQKWLRAIAVFAIFVLYAIAFHYWGFILSTAIFPPLVLLVMGGKKWQYFVSYYAVAAATYVLFVYGLRITLP